MATGGNILQSGSVTPGHLASWAADGVLQDAGAQVTGQRVLGRLLQANFNVTTDQPVIIPSSISIFQLTGIIITNAPTSLTTAAGGFYTAASKAGSIIVAASQIYTTLTGVNLLMNATLTAFAQSARFSANNLTNNTIYFSLTTAQGIAATADIYLVGIDLSA